LQRVIEAASKQQQRLAGKARRAREITQVKEAVMSAAARGRSFQRQRKAGRGQILGAEKSKKGKGNKQSAPDPCRESLPVKWMWGSPHLLHHFQAELISRPYMALDNRGLTVFDSPPGSVRIGL